MSGSGKTLWQLYQAHRGKVTDKWSSYLEAYDLLFAEFRDRPVNVLEIGVQNGGSLEIWAKYFATANKVVGCDIDPRCGDLRFDDPRIAVVVGDATTDATHAKLSELARSFDIIIDDGSHTSSHVVSSFLRYFEQLADGGLYIVEDTHASYWTEFSGGLFDPFSTMAFFERLADLVNREHWQADWPAETILNSFLVKYGHLSEPGSLAGIHSVEFANSLCILRKEAPASNRLGTRVVVGSQAAVDGSVVPLDGAPPSSAHRRTRPADIPPGAAATTSSREALALLAEVAALRQQILDLAANVAQAEKRNRDAAAQIAAQDSQLQLQQESARQLQFQLASAQAQLTDVQTGRAFALLTRYRAFVDRLLPPSSAARRLYGRLIALPRRLARKGSPSS